jgi:hypothetical protein
MKKTSIAVASLMLSAVVLAGCFGTKTETKDEFAIASCNDYVKLMKCVAEKSGGGAEALSAVDQAIAAWKTLPEDQLSQTCTMAMETAASNAAAYTQLGCEVPAVAPTEETTTGNTEVMTGEDTTVATGTSTTTGEDTTVVENVQKEVVASGTAQ